MPYSIDALWYRSVGPESLCKCTKFPQRALERRVGFRALIAGRYADRRDDQDDAEQLTGLWSGSPRYAPSCRETRFSATGLPITVILGNSVSDKRGSRKLRIASKRPS